MDRVLAEGPEPTLQKLRPVDYWLHYKLMQATGVERELGGEAQAIAALQALGDAYERKLRGAEADLPKLVPAAFTGEGMDSGFTGMGLGGFVGLMTGGMLSGAVSSMSDKDLAELVKQGPIKFGRNDGNSAVEFGKDGSLSQSMEFEVNENGLNGKVRIKTRMDACPDPQGRVYGNDAGSSWAATAGAGDVLSGIASALLAAGRSPLWAGAAAARVHARAARLASGGAPIGASDLLEAVPSALRGWGELGQMGAEQR